MKLKLALVGCGRIAQVHWKGIIESASSLVHVSACVDIFLPRAEAMAAKVASASGEPCEAFASLEQALATGDFVAVDIMLLHNQHEDASLAAFAAGKHVLLEKPMSITVESCQRIIHSSTAAGTVFMIAEQEEYNPAVLTAQRLIAEGQIGSVITAHAMGNSGSPQQHLKRNPAAGGQNAVLEASGMPSYSAVLEGDTREKAWRFQKSVTGGGVLIDGGSHTLRPLRMLMASCGEVTAVAAVLDTFNPDSEGETFVRAMLRFDNGRVGTLELLGCPSATYGPEPWRYRVLGEKGEIRIVPSQRNVEPDVVLFNDQVTEEDGRRYEHPHFLEHHGLVIADFAQSVLHGTPPSANAIDSLGESWTALAAYRAQESGQWEEVFPAGFWREQRGTAGKL